MARNRGQIRKRGDEKYLIRVYLGRVDGKRKYKSKTVYGDEHHAEKKLTEMLRRKDQGRLQERTDETVASFADEWLETKKGSVKPATYESYERYVRVYIKPALGHVNLEDLGFRLVQGFINDLDNEKGLAGDYVRQIHTSLQMILKKAVAWNLIHSNPADIDKISLPSKDERDYRTLDKAEIEYFLEAARGHRLYALFVLLVSTGLRPQEAFGLKWRDLDEDGWLRVRRVISQAPEEADDTHEVSDKMKTKASKRSIKLGSGVQQVLEEHRTRQAQEMLECGEEYDRRGFIFARGPHAETPGKFLYTEYTRRYFKKALERAGLPAEDIRLYDLRHTHITNLILDGTDLKFASKRAGHSSIQQTADTYAHLGDEAEEQMAEVTERMLQGAL